MSDCTVLLSQWCLEPGDSSVKMEQRCAGGSLVQGMESRWRYFNSGRAARVVSGSAMSSRWQQVLADDRDSGSNSGSGGDSGSDSCDEDSSEFDEPTAHAAMRAPGRVAGSYAAGAFSLYKQGFAEDDEAKLQQAARTVVGQRSMHVIRRYVSAATLTEE